MRAVCLPLLVACLSVVVASFGSPARASNASGFAVSRFDPAARSAGWFTGDSLHLDDELQGTVGVVADYAYKPLVIYDVDGAERAAIVRQQLTAHMGGDVVFARRFRVGVTVPVMLFAEGDEGTIGDTTFAPPTTMGAGDVRLDGDARLFNGPHDAITMAAGVRAFVPSGSNLAYSSDGVFRGDVHVLAAGESGTFAWTARAAFLYRGLDLAKDLGAVGSEVQLGGSAGLRFVDEKLLVGLEATTATVLAGDRFLQSVATPVDLTLGTHYAVAPGWTVSFGVARGLTNAIGEPQVRVLGGLAFTPPPPPPPPPPVVCPELPAPPPPAPPPPPDRDGDGIVDDDDRCVDVPGIASHDAWNGCPLDKDGDGVPNTIDACADDKGTDTTDAKTRGCVVQGFVDNQLTLDNVFFATDSDRILPASDATLLRVLGTLKTLPVNLRFTVEGHTDDRGGAAHNVDLSQRRARAVVAWFAAHGLDAARFEARGFGAERPIAPNDVEQNRQKNRRVELRILP